MSLWAISPVDGRYARQSNKLAVYTNEGALIEYRLRVEVAWLLCLCENPQMAEVRFLNETDVILLKEIAADFGSENSDRIKLRVKEIERSTNHDVKAVEYYLRERLENTTLCNLTPWIHFACTSEDINNLAYTLMLRDSMREVYLPCAREILQYLTDFAHAHADQPMLSHTHGQPATPTTLGKEIAVFVHRLRRQVNQIETQEYLGKINGAVGAFNAHAVAYPDVDWPAIAKEFVENQLGLVYNPLTTQIEPHDWIAELFHTLVRLHNILLDFVRDVWAYVSMGYLKQRTVAGEVGSSTMPHKVNPIDFENAEANLGIANALLEHLASKLTISRLQRDLSDSSAIRNVGSAIAYGFIALQSIEKGLGKIDVNGETIEAGLAANPEVLAEAIQTVLRKHGIADAYEQLKERTRGVRPTLETLRDFVRATTLPDAEKERLLTMEPRDYIGLAPQLARLA